MLLQEVRWRQHRYVIIPHAIDPVQLRKNKEVYGGHAPTLCSMCIVQFRVLELGNNELRVFCYGGEKSWNRIWSSLLFNVNSDGEEFKLVVGENASVLMEQFNNERSLFESWWQTDVTYQKHITVAPYASSCVGLTYHGSLSVSCSVIIKETGKRSCAVVSCNQTTVCI